MNDAQASWSSVPDALITWTTAAALIAFGAVFSSEAIIMGRIILALGILSAASEGLRMRALRTGPTGGNQRFRLMLAVAYVVLVSIGFISFVYLSERPIAFIY